MSDVTASSPSIVREVINKSTLKNFSTILTPKDEVGSLNNPISIKSKLLDVLINEVCGHVNNDLRKLWFVSCDCIRNEQTKDREEKCIEDMKINTQFWMYLYIGRLTKNLTRLKEDPYYHVVKHDLVLPEIFERKPIKPMKEVLNSPVHIPGDEPIVVLGKNSTYLSKSDFDKIPWSCTRSAARKLCRLIFSRDTILQTDFINTFLEPYKIVDIESCILSLSYSHSEDILKSIAKKCYDIHYRRVYKHMTRTEL